MPNEQYPGIQHLSPAVQGILVGRWFEEKNSMFASMMFRELSADIRLQAKIAGEVVSAMEKPTPADLRDELIARIDRAAKAWKARLPEGRTEGDEWVIGVAAVQGDENSFTPVIGPRISMMAEGKCTFPCYLSHPLFPSMFAEWLKFQPECIPTTI